MTAPHDIQATDCPSCGSPRTVPATLYATTPAPLAKCPNCSKVHPAPKKP
jgi:uncharacterized Zn finger protein